MRPHVLALVAALGCGRLGFEPIGADSGAPTVTHDASELDASIAGCAESCGSQQYCASPDGACGAPGSCLAIPLGCQQVFAPVCGCDSVTYDNRCFARQAGASIAHVGPCAGAMTTPTPTRATPRAPG